jgi:hypothetical protein
MKNKQEIRLELGLELAWNSSRFVPGRVPAFNVLICNHLDANLEQNQGGSV